MFLPAFAFPLRRQSWTLLLVWLALGRVQAETYTVTSGTDGGAVLTGIGSGTAGNLRYCIVQANANPGSTILIPGTLVSTLNGPLPLITASVTITNYILPEKAVIDGGGAHRIFFVDTPGATVRLENLTLRNGRAKGGNGAGGGGGGLGAGGALFVNRGNVEAVSVAFQNNTAIGGRGGHAYETVNGNATTETDGGGGGGGLGGNGGGSISANSFSNGPTQGGGGGGGLYGNGGDGRNGGGGGGGAFGNGANALNNGGGGGGLGDAGYSSSSGYPYSPYPLAGPGGGGEPFRMGPYNPAGAGADYGGGGGGGTGLGTEFGTGDNLSGGGADGGRFGGGGGASSLGGAITGQPLRGGHGGDFGGGAGGGSVYLNPNNRAGNGGWGGGGGASVAGWFQTAGYINGTGVGWSGLSGYGAGGAGSGDESRRRYGNRYGGHGGWGTGLDVNGFNSTQVTGPGGGGGALGGAVFIRQNNATQSAAFTATDCTFTGNTTTGGAPGNPSTLPQVFPTSTATGGTAAGAQMFIGHDTRLNVSTDTVWPFALETDDSESNPFREFKKGGTGMLTIGPLPSMMHKVYALQGVLRVAPVPTLATQTIGNPSTDLVVDGGTFDVNGRSYLIGALLGTGTGRVLNNAPGMQGSLTAGEGEGAGVQLFMDGVLADGAGRLSFNKVGPAHLFLSRANTYTGPTSVSGTGELVLNTGGGGTPILPAASSLFVDASVVKIIGSEYNAIGGSPVTLYHGGTVSAEASTKNSHTLGPLEFINGGRLAGFNPDPALGNFVLTGNVSIYGYGGVPSENQALINPSEIQLKGAITFDVEDGLPAADLRIDAIVRNFNNDATVGSLIKTGAGTLLLTASNTFSGGTTVNAGVIHAQSPDSSYGALGKGNVTVNSGIIEAEGNNALVGHNTLAAPARTFTINSGAGVQAKGTTSCHLFHLSMAGGQLTAEAPNPTLGNWNLDGGISTPPNAAPSSIVGGNLTLSQPGGTVFNIGANSLLTVDAVIDHLSQDTGLIKTGTGELRLLQSNRYTSTTTVNAGTLTLATASLADPSAITLATGATLNLTHSDTDAINQLIINGVTQPPGLYKSPTNPLPGTSTPAITGTGRLLIPSGDYNAWALSKSLTGSPLDDDDHDGFTNQDEYAFGLEPKDPSSSNPLISPGNLPGGQITYTRRRPGLTGLTYITLTSPDLTTWTPAVITETILGTANNIQTVRVTLSTAPPGEGRRFIQVLAR